MVANPEEDELSLLIGLLTLGIGKEIGGDGSVSNYDQRLITMRDKVRSAILLPKLKLSVIKSLSIIQHKVCQHSEFFYLKTSPLGEYQTEMYQRKQQAEAIQAAIDEVRTYFANIVAAAESLDTKLP